MSKKITVAIPTFNENKELLKDALRSVICQTINIDKIIISDDSSTRNTLHYLKEFRKEYPNRDISISQNVKNQGYVKNWNRCLELAYTDYVLILHADDILKRTTIEKQFYFLEKYPEVALVGGYEQLIDSNKNLLSSKSPSRTIIFKKGDIFEFVSETGSYIPCSSVMFNMQKIRTIGFFQVDVQASDELYWPKVLQHFPIAVLGESLILRRIHPGQTEYSDFRDKRKETIEWIDHFSKIAEYEKRPYLNNKLNKMIKMKIANGLVGNIFISSLKYHKSFLLAFYYLIYGIKTYPLIVLRRRFWTTMLKIPLIYLDLLYK